MLVVYDNDNKNDDNDCDHCSLVTSQRTVRRYTTHDPSDYEQGQKATVTPYLVVQLKEVLSLE